MFWYIFFFIFAFLLPINYYIVCRRTKSMTGNLVEYDRFVVGSAKDDENGKEWENSLPFCGNFHCDGHEYSTFFTVSGG
jgi:hypothetical protein